MSEEPHTWVLGGRPVLRVTRAVQMPAHGDRWGVPVCLACWECARPTMPRTSLQWHRLPRAGTWGPILVPSKPRGALREQGLGRHAWPGPISPTLVELDTEYSDTGPGELSRRLPPLQGTQGAPRVPAQRSPEWRGRKGWVCTRRLACGPPGNPSAGLSQASRRSGGGSERQGPPCCSAG